jgi:hypothetical protein
MYFRDIYEVTVALDDAQTRRLINELEAFGYAIREDGKMKICKGPGIKFIVTPLNTSTGGITKLKMSLLRKKQGQKTYKFGAKSVLTFKGKTASWVSKADLSYPRRQTTACTQQRRALLSCVRLASIR